MKLRLVQLTIVSCVALFGAACEKEAAVPPRTPEVPRALAVGPSEELLKIERVAIICGAPDEISDRKCRAESSALMAVVAIWLVLRLSAPTQRRPELQARRICRCAFNLELPADEKRAVVGHVHGILGSRLLGAQTVGESH